MLRQAAAEGPLPDEYQAAALWWRIARHACPAVLTPDRDAAPGDLLRPDWLPALTSCLGAPATDTLSADPRWPAVITAITTGSPSQTTPLADALIYRALSMTDPVPFDPSDPYETGDPYQDTEPGTPQASQPRARPGRTEHSDRPGDQAYPLDPYDDDLIPPKDLHLVSIELDPNAPLNLAVPDIEAPYGQRPPAADNRGACRRGRVLPRHPRTHRRPERAGRHVLSGHLLRLLGPDLSR